MKGRWRRKRRERWQENGNVFYRRTSLKQHNKIKQPNCHLIHREMGSVREQLEQKTRRSALFCSHLHFTVTDRSFASVKWQHKAQAKQEPIYFFLFSINAIQLLQRRFYRKWRLWRHPTRTSRPGSARSARPRSFVRPLSHSKSLIRRSVSSG